MTLNHLCKTCCHVDMQEVIHGHKVAGMKPVCDYLQPAFPAARKCDGHEPHLTYDEARTDPALPGD